MLTEVGFGSSDTPSATLCDTPIQHQSTSLQPVSGDETPTSWHLEAALKPLEFIPRAVGTNFDDSRHPK